MNMGSEQPGRSPRCAIVRIAVLRRLVAVVMLAPPAVGHGTVASHTSTFGPHISVVLGWLRWTWGDVGSVDFDPALRCCVLQRLRKARTAVALQSPVEISDGLRAWRGLVVRLCSA